MNFFPEINAQQGQLLSGGIPPGGTPVLVSLTVSGPTEVEENTSAQYVCTANYSDDTHAVVSATWFESSPYASIDANGLLTAGNVLSDQNVTITASFGGKIDTHVITIKYVAPTLNSIVIEGPSSLDEETSQQYSCTARWSDGTSTTVSPVWSDNSSYATITSAGLLHVGAVESDQNVVITAIWGGKADTHSVTIRNVPPVLSGITISGSVTVNEQTTAQYTCVANYSDGTSATVSPTWSESSPDATIDANGLLTAGNVLSDQNVTITASFGGKIDTHVITIFNK